MFAEARSPIVPAVVEIIKNTYVKSAQVNFHGVSSMADSELKRERNAGIRKLISGLTPSQRLVKIYKMTLKREMTFGIKYVDETETTHIAVVDELGQIIAKGVLDGQQLKWVA
jgi:gamma-glutamyltranspeptidase